jgi:hypothetical protein
MVGARFQAVSPVLKMAMPILGRVKFIQSDFGLGLGVYCSVMVQGNQYWCVSEGNMKMNHCDAFNYF